MPRASDGTYTLPAGNPVTSGTTIQSAWANNTLSDIETALTDSLDRQGRGGMLAAFKFADGIVTAPSITWTNEPSTGIYRAGLGDMRVAISATDSFRWTSTGADIWTGSAWAPVLYEGGPAGGMPPGDSAFESIAWDNTGLAWVPTDQFTINYSVGDIANTRDADVGRNLTVGGTLGATGAANLGSTLVVTGATTLQNGLSVTGNISVTGTVDGVDIAALNTTVSAHTSDATIHYTDAPADSKQYARTNNAWTEVAATGQVIPPGTADAQTLAWDSTSSEYITKNSLKLLDSGNAAFTGSLEIGTSSTTISNSGNDMLFAAGAGEIMRVQNDGVGIGTIPDPSAVLDVDGKIYTETKPLTSSGTGTDLKWLRVEDTLPVTPDPNTLYFLTTAP